MFEALLIDFYGTVVHEDDDVVAEICQIISMSMPVPTDPRTIGRYWWNSFVGMFMDSQGPSFRRQRELEHESLVRTIEYFSATSDPDLLSEMMFEHWSTAALFDDALPFLDEIKVPIVVLSNIDRVDIESVIDHHGMRFTGVVTSEDVRAYKPHPSMFHAGLRAAGVADPSRVLHVGDSIVSDVQGANRCGLAVAWINRTGKVLEGSAEPDHVVTDLRELLPLVST